MVDFELVPFDEYRYKPSVAIGRACEDKSFWTDGCMLLKLKHMRGTIKRMFERQSAYERIVNVSTEGKKKVWESQWEIPRTRATLSPMVRKRRHNSAIVLTADGCDQVFISADRAKFLTMKIPDCSFHISSLGDKHAAVAIKSGKKRVGVLMPLRM